jgi:hypothetical protein
MEVCGVIAPATLAPDTDFAKDDVLLQAIVTRRSQLMAACMLLQAIYSLPLGSQGIFADFVPYAVRNREEDGAQMYIDFWPRSASAPPPCVDKATGATWHPLIVHPSLASVPIAYNGEWDGFIGIAHVYIEQFGDARDPRLRNLHQHVTEAFRESKSSPEHPVWTLVQKEVAQQETPLETQFTELEQARIGG